MQEHDLSFVRAEMIANQPPPISERGQSERKLAQTVVKVSPELLSANMFTKRLMGSSYQS